MQVGLSVPYHTNTTFGKTSQSKDDHLAIYLVFQWPVLTVWVPAVKTIFMNTFRTSCMKDHRHEADPDSYVGFNCVLLVDHLQNTQNSQLKP